MPGSPRLGPQGRADGAILHWDSFSIGKGYTTRFEQPSASSSVLNRVVGASPSQIYGTLSSNGKVWLINPNGIVIGPTGVVDTAGFVASTLNVSDANFLAGKLTFDTPGAGDVVNQGSITTASGGSVYLIGSNVSNEGVITTPQGETILAAGKTVEMVDTGTPGVKVTITGAAGNTTNLGSILAAAGRIGMAGVIVRNTGLLDASSVVNEGGRIFLKASQDTYVDKSGRIVATGTKGGQVEVLGNRVAVMDNAEIDVSGTHGGGTILVGGDYQAKNADVQNAQVTYFGADAKLKANATDNGDGGKVIVWADDTTRAFGTISARGGANSGNGGFVETSGHRYLDVKGVRGVDTRAPQGKGGNWLLDPGTIAILHATSPGNSTGMNLNGGIFGSSNVTSTLTDYDINTNLAGSNITITTSQGPGSVGDIIVASGVSIYNSSGVAHSLTLHADDNIILGDTSGAISFNSDLNSNLGLLTLRLDAGNAISTHGSTTVYFGKTPNAGNSNSTGSVAVQVLNGKTWTNNGSVVLAGANTSIDLTGGARFNNNSSLLLRSTISDSTGSVIKGSDGFLKNSGYIYAEYDSKIDARFDQDAGGQLTATYNQGLFPAQPLGVTLNQVGTLSGLVDFTNGTNTNTTATPTLTLQGTGGQLVDTRVSGTGTIKIGGASNDITISGVEAPSATLNFASDNHGLVTFTGKSVFRNLYALTGGYTSFKFQNSFLGFTDTANFSIGDPLSGNFFVPGGSVTFLGSVGFAAAGNLDLRKSINTDGDVTLIAGWSNPTLAGLDAPTAAGNYSVSLSNNFVDTTCGNIKVLAGGTFSTSGSMAFLSSTKSGGNITIQAGDINLAGTAVGQIGADSVVLTTAGDMFVGTATGSGFNLSNTELSRISARSLTLDGLGATVNGVTSLGYVDQVVIHTGNNGLSFGTTKSYFNALTGTSDAWLRVDGDIETTAGNLMLGNSLIGGTWDDAFHFAAGGSQTLTSAGNIIIGNSANVINGGATVNLSAVGDVDFRITSDWSGSFTGNWNVVAGGSVSANNGAIGGNNIALTSSGGNMNLSSGVHATGNATLIATNGSIDVGGTLSAANTLSVTAKNDVTIHGSAFSLNSNSSIIESTTGNVAVSTAAGGDIALNDGQIRAANGSVTLASRKGISQTASDSIIQANTLTATATAGPISLLGNNLVSRFNGTASTNIGFHSTQSLTIGTLSASGGRNISSNGSLGWDYTGGDLLLDDHYSLSAGGDLFIAASNGSLTYDWASLSAGGAGAPASMMLTAQSDLSITSALTSPYASVALIAGNTLSITGDVTSSTGGKLMTVGNTVYSGSVLLMGNTIDVRAGVHDEATTPAGIAIIGGNVAASGPSAYVKSDEGGILGALSGNVSLSNGAYFEAGTDITLGFAGTNSTLSLTSSPDGIYKSYLLADSPHTINLAFARRYSGGVMIDGVETTTSTPNGTGLFAINHATPAVDGAGLNIEYATKPTTRPATLSDVISAINNAVTAAPDHHSDVAAPRSGGGTGDTQTAGGTTGGGDNEFGGGDKDNSNGEPPSGGGSNDNRPHGHKVGRCSA